mgnify:CR=1 FL=1
MIHSVFVLAMYDLVGLQIYQGTLINKCVRNPETGWKENRTEEELDAWYNNESEFHFTRQIMCPVLVDLQATGMFEMEPKTLWCAVQGMVNEHISLS